MAVFGPAVVGTTRGENRQHFERFREIGNQYSNKIPLQTSRPRKLLVHRLTRSQAAPAAVMVALSAAAAHTTTPSMRMPCPMRREPRQRRHPPRSQREYERECYRQSELSAPNRLGEPQKSVRATVEAVEAQSR
jgi:hypothetical protein